MSSIIPTVYLIGSASGLAAADAGCGDGPLQLKESPYLSKALHEQGIDYQWEAMLKPVRLTSESVLNVITRHCQDLANTVADVLAKKHFFSVFGGDHSCAIGTWSGAQQALVSKGPLGLIWVDAHMDSHTPETSLTGNIHGMPLACLLGHGDPGLTTISNKTPKILPEHLCLVGIRSFESAEADLLKKLNVRIFYMDEVKRRGLDIVMAEAREIARQGTAGYGVTIDIDSIDPEDAPGTGVPEPDGISALELCHAVRVLAQDKHLIGVEIVEFDPHRDKNHITEQWVAKILATLMTGQIITL
jgi:arginase